MSLVCQIPKIAIFTSFEFVNSDDSNESDLTREDKKCPHDAFNIE